MKHFAAMGFVIVLVSSSWGGQPPAGTEPAGPEKTVPRYSEATNSPHVHEWSLDVDSAKYQYDVCLGEKTIWSTAARNAKGRPTSAIKVCLDEISEHGQLHWLITYGPHYPGGTTGGYPSAVSSNNSRGTVTEILPVRNPGWQGDECLLSTVGLYEGTEVKIVVKRIPQHVGGANPDFAAAKPE